MSLLYKDMSDKLVCGGATVGVEEVKQHTILTARIISICADQLKQGHGGVSSPRAGGGVGGGGSL